MLTKFKLLIHESTGQKYEDLFVKIMGYSDDSFEPVKAYGNTGDRGNDGWCPEFGRYYQVYAPENVPRNNKESLTKLKNDFQKLKEYWSKISEIKEYYFVINDKFAGIPPHLTEAIKELEYENGLVKAKVMSAKDLERLFLKLAPNFRHQVVFLGLEAIQPWELFKLCLNVSDAKWYFNEFRTNRLSLLIYNTKTVVFSYDILVKARHNLSNLGVENTSLISDVEYLINNFNELDWEDKEAKCVNIQSKISLDYPQRIAITNLAGSYSKLRVYSALGKDYSVLLVNFKSSLYDAITVQDEFMNNSLKDIENNQRAVLGKLNTLDDTINDKNYSLIVKLHSRLEYLISKEVN
ncbi:hypothetical protein [Shewanella baltica]|jgi:hypothetical protein|uniref:hypothetical protein n=1 Tax=Shewanella baltica TaxID=62322 RepID=UPI0039AEC639